VSLFKRGDVWWAYFYRDGLRHQYSTGTSNRRQAETVEAKLKEEVNNRRFQIVESDPHIAFSELAAKFLESGSARKHHKYHLKFLLPYFAELEALRITKSLAEEFRSTRKQRNPAIKDATINRDLSVLRHILYWSVDEQLIVSNPLARMRMARERRTRRQVLSVAEENSLLAAATNHLHGMVIAALDTGMRRGEITSQRWEDVDFSQRVLFVTRSKTPEGESREIPLTARLHEFLVARRKGEGLVIDFHDRPVRIVKRTWKTALKNAQIRHVRFHDLRHTFNTRLMEAGVLQEIRMALMGHSSGSKVHSIYTHIELPVKRDAIRKLEQWVKDQPQQMKEKPDANSESERSETGQSSSTGNEAGTQSLEEKVARRSGPGASRQAEIRDRRDGRRAEGQAAPASEVRRGQKAVRGRVEP